MLAGFVREHRKQRGRDREAADADDIFLRLGPGRLRDELGQRRGAAFHTFRHLHDGLRIRLGLPGLQSRDPVRERAMREPDELEQAFVCRTVFLLPQVHHLLHRPGRLAQPQQPDHAPAALEGVESAPHRRQLPGVGRLGAAHGETLPDRLEHADGFLQEDGEQLVVDRLVAFALEPLGVGRRRLDRRCDVYGGFFGLFRIRHGGDQQGRVGQDGLHGRLEVGLPMTQGVDEESKSRQDLGDLLEFALLRPHRSARKGKDPFAASPERGAGLVLAQHGEDARDLVDRRFQRREFRSARRVAEVAVQRLFDLQQVRLHLGHGAVDCEFLLGPAGHGVDQRHAQRHVRVLLAEGRCAQPREHHPRLHGELRRQVRVIFDRAFHQE